MLHKSTFYARYYYWWKNEKRMKRFLSDSHGAVKTARRLHGNAEGKEEKYSKFSAESTLQKKYKERESTREPIDWKWKQCSSASEITFDLMRVKADFLLQNLTFSQRLHSAIDLRRLSSKWRYCHLEWPASISLTAKRLLTCSSVVDESSSVASVKYMLFFAGITENYGTSHIFFS